MVDHEGSPIFKIAKLRDKEVPYLADWEGQREVSSVGLRSVGTDDASITERACRKSYSFTSSQGPECPLDGKF